MTEVILGSTDELVEEVVIIKDHEALLEQKQVVLHLRASRMFQKGIGYMQSWLTLV